MTPAKSRVSITAVIVLYRQAPNDSDAFRTLQEAYREASHSGLQLDTILFDNTPNERRPQNSLPDGVVYVAAACNEGLAKAYNHAVEFGRQHDAEWLLTLDQDTQLPSDFLLKMYDTITSVMDTPVVAAIVPQIIGDGRILSPNTFTYGFPSWFPLGYTGVSPKPTFAFNSAALIRLSALQQIGGYDPWFWLDSSDMLLFSKLASYGKRVFVAGNIQVQHNFSMMDMRRRVSPGRYRNILLAESAFWDSEMSVAAGWERTARLVVRLVKHLVRGDPPELRRSTSEFIKRRLFWSKRRRLQQWQHETRSLMPSLGSEPAPQTTRTRDLASRQRPRVSVCMAAYNGEPYIELQLRSILSQLEPADEIVIVDDASTDATTQVIRSMNSSLIHLVQHATNKGVLETFEDAIRDAQGEILFLADGDDLWAPDKVKRFLQAFAENPGVDIVTSQVTFIDQHGNPTDDNMYSNRKQFQSGFWHNLLRNHFQGSAMAFRASLLRYVLPFPRNVGFMHDHWIGMRNAREGGSAICVELPLLLYRRHQGNLSGRMSRSRQVRVRLQLLLSHLVAEFRHML